jgi:hypothetical protein
MAKIQGKTYRFNASTSPDVVSYLLVYGLNSGTDVDLDTAARMDAQAVSDGAGKMAINLEAVLLSEPEGVYDLAVVAVDDAGNESDYGAVVRSVNLDFTPPEAPTAGEVVAS